MSDRSWEANLEEKVKKLEREIEEMGRRVERESENFEKKVERFGRDVEKKAENWADEAKKHKPSGGGFFWGIVFLAAGVIWLGNAFGWFYYDVPWAALFLIAGGLYMIMKHRNHSKQDEDTL